MKCKKHPKYKGLQKPRVACEACWQIWFGISEACINCGCIELDRTYQCAYDMYRAEKP